MARFADLNLLVEENSCQRSEGIRAAIKLGYETVCVNNHVEELSVKTGKKVKDKVVAIKPTQEVLVPSDVFETIVEEHKVLSRHQPKQYSRITAVVSDLSQSIRLKEASVQSYDVVAVQPMNQKVFLEACKTYAIDLISVDLSQRMDSMLLGKSARTAVGCAVSRGIHFEIVYAPMIRDASARRSTITNANLLVELCRGRNVIISSGTNKAVELRGPYDVSHLGVMFGLSAEQARNALTSNCRAVIMHGVARKSANGVLSCCKISSLPASHHWKLSNSSIVTQSKPTEESSEQIGSRKKRRKLS